MSAPRIRFTRNVVHTEKQQVARFIIGAAVILNDWFLGGVAQHAFVTLIF